MIDSIDIVPSATDLRQRLRAARSDGDRPILGRTTAEWRHLHRTELGLPIDGPVVMAGHQPAFWHPGIVVKSMLAEHLAGSLGGCAVHVIVEQDVHEAGSVEVPVRTEDGGLARARVDFLKPRPGVVSGALPPFDPAPIPRLDLALPEVGPALERMHAALAARRNEINAATQVTAAAFDLLAPVLAAPMPLRSSALLRTTQGRSLLRRMAEDPEDMAIAYNAAVGSEHAAAPLRTLDDRVEIPLWRLDDQGRRLRAWDDDLERFESGAIELMPRALLMTGLLRLAACDLFIHGTGGVAYDAAMERWLSTWLGARVAPTAMATATVTLPFPLLGEPAADLDAARRDWRRGWFDPDLLDERTAAPAGPSPRKREFLARIDALPRRSLDRRIAWRRMHEAIEDARRRHERALVQRRESLEHAHRRSRQRPIEESRTWPFPFHSQATLAELRRGVER